VYAESGRAGYDDGGPGIRRLSTDVVIVETKLGRCVENLIPELIGGALAISLTIEEGLMSSRGNSHATDASALSLHHLASTATDKEDKFACKHKSQGQIGYFLAGTRCCPGISVNHPWF